MGIAITESHDGKVLEVDLTGKLVADDYKRFVPVVDRVVEEHNKVRMLVEMHDFHGWTGAALWEDVMFDVHHFSDIERLAIVGEKKWQRGMATFCKPFTSATVRYFDRSQAQAAHDWIESDIQTVH